TPQLSHAFFVQFLQVPALEENFAFEDFTRGVNQTNDGEARHGFARAGFSHQAEDFSSPHCQVDTVYGRPGPCLGMESGAQTSHLQNDFTHQRLGSRASRRRSPTMLIDRMSSSSATPGNMLIQ